jgi:putative zinc finger/helix-turn-helix YgiT family protein
MTLAESCPICGSADLSTQNYDGQIRTRDGAELPYTAEHSKCRNCGEEFFTRRQSRASSRAAAAAKRAYGGLLTPAEIASVRAKYGVTQALLERILKLGKKTVVRWEAGTVCQSQAADQLLREVRDSPGRFFQLADEAGVVLRGAVASQPQSYVLGTSATVHVRYGKPLSRKRRSGSGDYRVVRSESTVTRGSPVACYGGV